MLTQGSDSLNPSMDINCALDGNSSDKKNFHDSLDKMAKFQKEVQNAPDFIFVADSALYTKDKLLTSPNLRWLTRIPRAFE